MEADDLVKELQRMGSLKGIEGMARFGIKGSQMFGVSVSNIRTLAKTAGKSHELAKDLWKTGIHEARILAGMIDVPEQVTEEQMEAWVRDFDSWDLVDQTCANLFDKTAFAVKKALEWSKREREYEKRAGFSMMAMLAVHDKEARDMESLYEHAGGEEALHHLEELFYSKVLADPVLKVLFTERKPHHVDHLTWFTAESFGGPDRFTRELGFQHIINVHRQLNITDEQRERFVALYMEAADEAGLPADEPFREALRSHVEFGSRVAQQNSRAKTDADLHSIRKVPSWQWPSKK